jgi:hypothetical protein
VFTRRYAVAAKAHDESNICWRTFADGGTVFGPAFRPRHRLQPDRAPIADTLDRLEPNGSRVTADLHTAFYLMLATIFIFPLGWSALLLTRFLPERAKPNIPRHLCMSMRRPRHAIGRARLCRSRGRSSGRHRRDHAASSHDSADDRRSPPCRRGQPDGQRRRQARRRGETLRDATHAGESG